MNTRFCCLAEYGELYLFLMFQGGVTRYAFYTPIVRYSVFVLKVPLNTTNQTSIALVVLFCYASAPMPGH